MPDKYKLHPRNATARQSVRVAGNTASTLLESGIGNCFPGLECDVRNLERRFFPHLVVDFGVFVGSRGPFIRVAEVNLAEAQAAGLPPQAFASYQKIAQDTSDTDPDNFWFVERITGSFGPFGDLTISRAEFGDANRPADGWTAVRLLPEGDDVTLVLNRGDATSSASEITLTAPRNAYLRDDGALADGFEPGELTQSLCSPWTHDFRDCGCFYWASNHPDISLPPKPAGSPPSVALDRPTAWQRSDRGSATNPPPAAVDTQFPDEMRHYEISHRWQELGIVLDGREQPATYVPRSFTAVPFDTIDELAQELRYAAGVELAVALEYLSAAYSLDRAASGGTLSDDVNASFAEMMRIAIGEMKHLREANDILRALFERGLIPDFEPALQVAAELPAGGGTSRPLAFRALTMATLDSFIDLERPSFSIDALYARILATVQERVPGPLEQVVRSIMADGSDHFETFSFIKEWLGRHAEADYLLNLSEPDGSVQAHSDLQAKYLEVLVSLHDGYTAGLPGGVDDVATARASMLARPNGVRGLCETLAGSSVRVLFEAPNDPRFQPIPRP